MDKKPGVNQEKWEQTFFNQHGEDVVSFAIHPSRQIAATGQMASTGKATCIDIYVWDIESKEILGRFNDFHRRAVYILQFSPSGQLLASIGQDNDNSVAIYDWKTKRLVATSPVDKAKVNSVCWQGDESFVTCGSKHIKFWDIKGRNISQ